MTDDNSLGYEYEDYLNWLSEQDVNNILDNLMARIQKQVDEVHAELEPSPIQDKYTHSFQRGLLQGLLIAQGIAESERDELNNQ